MHVLVKRIKKSKENGGALSDAKDASNSNAAIVSPARPDESRTNETGEHAYMTVASEIRRVLHDFGIHSSTIQPEYVMDGPDDEAVSSLLTACASSVG